MNSVELHLTLSNFAKKFNEDAGHPFDEDGIEQYVEDYLTVKPIEIDEQKINEIIELVNPENEEQRQLMLEYAKQHMRVAMTDPHREMKTLASMLSMSMQVLKRLNLQGKSVDVSLENTETFSFNLHVSEKQYDAFFKTSDPQFLDLMDTVIVDEISNGINEMLKNEAGLRLGLLVSSISTMSEGTDKARIFAHSRFSIIH